MPTSLACKCSFSDLATLWLTTLHTSLNDTFKWTGAGLAVTAAVAKGLHSSGFAVRLMASNPWLVMGVGLVGSIGSMMAVYYTEPGTPLHCGSVQVCGSDRSLTSSAS